MMTVKVVKFLFSCQPATGSCKKMNILFDAQRAKVIEHLGHIKRFCSSLLRGVQCYHTSFADIKADCIMKGGFPEDFPTSGKGQGRRENGSGFQKNDKSLNIFFNLTGNTRLKCLYFTVRMILNMSKFLQPRVLTNLASHVSVKKVFRN